MTSTNVSFSNILHDDHGTSIVKPVNSNEGDPNSRTGGRSANLKETEFDTEEVGVDDGLLPPPTPVPSPPSRPDINMYQQRKTLAQGMMDVALLTANANQLRIALERETDNYYTANVTLISLSITIQIMIGICLIWNSSYNVNKGIQLRKANRVNNITIVGIFVVTVLNVFISAFGISSEMTTPGTNLVPK